jgi:hypothetical protein
MCKWIINSRLQVQAVVSVMKYCSLLMLCDVTFPPNSLWFIHLPSYAMQSGSKAPACLQSAYEFLVKIQKMKLQPTDEASFTY